MSLAMKGSILFKANKKKWQLLLCCNFANILNQVSENTMKLLQTRRTRKQFKEPEMGERPLETGFAKKSTQN